MSENTHETNTTHGKTGTRRPGKTLLVKQKDNKKINEKWLATLENLKVQESSEEKFTKTVKTGSYFLEFEDIKSAENALEKLQKEHSDSLMVKFAHYRVFFTINGLDDDSDYNLVKKTFTDYIEKETNASVLYFKLYRNKKFLGCGDFTIDTKSSLDQLLDKEQLKEYDFGDGLSGSFFRFNRKGPKNEESNE